MEEIVLLFLLMMLSGDEKTRRSMQNFLTFYKENRELLSLLANRPTPPVQPPKEPKHEESRPREEVGPLGILEEYLKRCAV